MTRLARGHVFSASESRAGARRPHRRPHRPRRRDAAIPGAVGCAAAASGAGGGRQVGSLSSVRARYARRAMFVTVNCVCTYGTSQGSRAEQGHCEPHRCDCLYATPLIPADLHVHWLEPASSFCRCMVMRSFGNVINYMGAVLYKRSRLTNNFEIVT